MLRFTRLIGLGVSSALVLLLAGTPAAAQDDDIEYTRTGSYLVAGLSFADTHFDDRPNFGTGWGFNALAGYRANEHFAIEAEVEYFSHLIVRDGSPRQEAATIAAMINTKVPLFSGPLQPFMRYGIGMLDAEVTGLAVRDTHDADFAMRFGGGLDVYFSDNLGLSTSIDYLRGFGDVRDFRYMSVRTAVMYRF